MTNDNKGGKCGVQTGAAAGEGREVSGETSIIWDNIPSEILQSDRAVLWNMEKRDGKLTKVPYIPRDHQRRAAVDNPSTWGTFVEARAAVEDGKADGLGVVLGDNLAGVDLDGCRNPETGAITAEAEAIIRELNSYTEASPSRTGVKIFLRGTLPPGRRRKGKIEMYADGRFFTVTGWHVEGTTRTIEERNAPLAAFHARLFGSNGNGRRQTGSDLSDEDAVLLDRARRAANGARFTQLWKGNTSGYASASEADLALCSLLAFWTGGDAGRIDRLFRGSGLMRDKWNEARGHQTYGERTITQAIADCRETYRGNGAGAARAHTPITEYRLSDVGNAARFAAMHGHDLRYVGVWGRWLCWDGIRWQPDETGEVMRRAREVAMSVYSEAAAEPDEMRRKALSQHAVRLDSDAKLRAMLHLAESEPVIAVRGDVFDRDPWLFNCQNGTLDLRTDELYPHRREDYITKCVPVAYDPSAACPTWDPFLRRIFAEDSELIAYVQRVAGYCLTGDVSEQGLDIFFGSGANGKTTALKTLLAMVGDYGKQAAPGLLMRKYGETHPTELADLRGARLVVVTEVEEGQRLAEVLVKQLTGGDRLKARFMRQDFHEFDPTFKIVMAVNHLPRIIGTDHAIWRRIRTTPFRVTIPVAEQDTRLAEKLTAELPGILAWAVRGCLEWRRGGLAPPPQVTGATAAYRAEMDTIGDFLRDYTRPDAAGIVTAKAIYAAYLRWCEENGERPLSQKQLGGRLTERGFNRRRGGQGHLWVGLALEYMTHDPS